MLNIAINGFGRIGRLLYRALIEQQAPVNIVAVHDLCDVQTARHLLVYDSQYGPWNQTVVVKGEHLLVAGQNTVFLQGKAIAELPWSAYDVDVVIEATGEWKTRAQLLSHLNQGAGRVLLTTSSAEVDCTVIYGVNHLQIGKESRLLSAASCTSNCLIPLLSLLQKTYGLTWADFLTVHAQTPDQSLLDGVHRDWYRARTASQSIIPTSTNATETARRFFPDLPIHGQCVRVPVTSVSMLHLSCHLRQQPASLEDIKESIVRTLQQDMLGVVDCTHEPLVSIDCKGRSASAIISMNHMRYQAKENKLHLLAWYDNEWGYVQRLVDIISHL